VAAARTIQNLVTRLRGDLRRRRLFMAPQRCRRLYDAPDVRSCVMPRDEIEWQREFNFSVDR